MSLFKANTPSPESCEKIVEKSICQVEDAHTGLIHAKQQTEEAVATIDAQIDRLTARKDKLTKRHVRLESMIGSMAEALNFNHEEFSDTKG